jgi:hypothetical protein
LAGCQSTITYEPIIPNPPNLEMTNARCNLMSSSAQQGYFAMGSQAYVAGAAIGNAIGNAIAVDNFMRQCMLMNGWRRVEGGQKDLKINQVHPVKMGGAFPKAPDKIK